ncbi:HdeD family acid-resistance protein [Cerasicoccus arenae]|uniref:HdeD family acid-resistance protein n=1 Tax=Cerasicoccus arenae TaxID=424488 RepID=A0A8J3GBY0_9BACT|nr:DUF308 domain-containing protein [Cerasicoccus arenae]MBK1859434.1 DUF308 domain-containing protein [Cerasicoccus arenae]GHB94099.1 hypothetical protein GCM10007047_07190 [Cerasicoccus arenae]
MNLKSPFAGIDPEKLKKNASQAQLAGIILIILGVLAVMLPGVFSLGLELFLGWLLLIGGILQAVSAFSHITVKGYGWALISSVLAAIVGALLIAQPVIGVIALTGLLAIFYLIDGIFKLLAAAQGQHLPGRGIIFMNGIFGLIIAGIVFSEWPSAAHWFIGLIVGVNFLMGGMTLLTLASAAKKSA